MSFNFKSRHFIQSIFFLSLFIFDIVASLFKVTVISFMVCKNLPMIHLKFGPTYWIFILLELPWSQNIKTHSICRLIPKHCYHVYFYLWKLKQIVCCYIGTNDNFVEHTTWHIFRNTAEWNALKEITCRLVYLSHFPLDVSIVQPPI
jgi:hypothetical protein